MPLTLTILSPNPDPCAAWLQQGGITAHPLHALPHAPWLPPYTLPVLLDSPGYQADPLVLCRFLAHLARRPTDPVLALVAPTDRRARTLLHHCPNTTLLLAPQTDPTLLATWLRLTAGALPRELTPYGPAVMGAVPLPPPHPLPSLPLPLPTLLATLANASSWQDAAHRLGFTSRHLRRLQRGTAEALGDPLRYTGPQRWVAQVLAALADGGHAEDSSPLERVQTP
jgi:hypothetical protein